MGGKITMKIENIKDIDKFFEVVDSCKGRVEPVSYTHLDVYKRQDQQ